MVCRLIHFTVVILKLFMFKTCGSIGIFKMEIFNFSGTERVKKKNKKLENHSKPPNITIRVNIAFTKQFLKNVQLPF